MPLGAMPGSPVLDWKMRSRTISGRRLRQLGLDIIKDRGRTIFILIFVPRVLALINFKPIDELNDWLIIWLAELRLVHGSLQAVYVVQMSFGPVKQFFRNAQIRSMQSHQHKFDQLLNKDNLCVVKVDMLLYTMINLLLIHRPQRQFLLQRGAVIV